MGGGDKAAASTIGGVTILDRVLAAAARRNASRLIINANGDPARFADDRPAGGRRRRAGFRRPARRHSRRARLGGGACARTSPIVASVPGDCPFLPRDLVDAAASGARRRPDMPLACARSGEWRHPVVGLWPVALRDDLRQALTVEGLRKIEVWTARHGVALADWPAEPVDPFFNVNTPEDAAAADRIAAQHPEAWRCEPLSLEFAAARS